MYTSEKQKSNLSSFDLIPQIQSNRKSNNTEQWRDTHVGNDAMGIRDFSAISILSSNNGSVQPKLKINTPGDKFEKEADRIADNVMQSPSNKVQRACSKCKDEEQLIQTKSKGDSGSTAPNGFAHSLSKSRNGGQSLDSGTRKSMESKIGANFSGVRIHSDSRAAMLNQEINARAFTLGNDIYFNKGEYSPSNQEGKRLLAHELVHTIQQGSAGNQGLIQREDKKDKKKKDKVKTKIEVVGEHDFKKGESKVKASTTRSADAKVSEGVKAAVKEKTTGDDKTVTAEVKASDKKSGLSVSGGVKATETSNLASPDKADLFLKVGGKWTLLDSSLLKLTTEPAFKLSTDKGPQLTFDNKAVFFPNGTLTPEIAAGFLLDKKGFKGEAKAKLKYQVIDFLSLEAGMTFTLTPKNTFVFQGGLGVVLSF